MRRKDQQRVTIDLPLDLHHKLKIAGVMQRKPIRGLVVESLIEYFDKQEKEQAKKA